jgi:hypothetical protein
MHQRESDTEDIGLARDLAFNEAISIRDHTGEIFIIILTYLILFFALYS